MEDANVGMSEAVLEQNPKFWAIHSKDSVQKIIEKAGHGDVVIWLRT